jgi:general secretion pathway protein C
VRKIQRGSKGMVLVRSIVLIAVVGCGLACTPSAPQEPKRIDEIRAIPPAHRVTNYTLQRRDLQAALSKGIDNTVRLVPIYESAASRLSNEHRVFDLRPGSVYALLGIENSDILVAADGYLIKKPEQFVMYIQLLTKQNEATIEIRRGGEPRLLKYTFLPALSQGASQTKE